MNIDETKSVLNYDEKTGVFTWKVSRSKHRPAGSIAGSINDAGYRTIMINGKNYRAHRLAWLFHYGEMPDCDIDHINGIRTDNRIENLRLDKNKMNSQNMHGAKCTSRSGIAGVQFTEATKRWRSRICVNRKNLHIGYFATKEEAYSAYLDAKRRLHPFSTVWHDKKDNEFTTTERIK